jgi:predicted DNA-binding protein with PD1-like motif
MKSRRLDRERWILVFQKGEEVLSTLGEFASRQKIAGASFQAIGGFSHVTLAFFDLAAKEYRPIPVSEQVEVVSLAGNVARVSDDLKVHAHAVVSRADGSACGGHLLEGHVRPTLELFLSEAGELRRKKDEETGLPLLDV